MTGRRRLKQPFRAGKWAGLALVAALVAAGVLARLKLEAELKAPSAPAGPDAAPPGFHFTDVTERMGINFRVQYPVLDPLLRDKPLMFFSYTGVAVADFDGDGWMDILLVNSAKGARNHLYLNQQGKSFREAAEEWGIAYTNEDGGATVTPVVFDFDNDGRPDVYLARLGCSMLLRNTGHGFENVTKKSGLGDCLNSTGAVPLDFDGDGKLDLFVFRWWPALDYFHLSTPKAFFNSPVEADNGGVDTLYRNRGDGTFEDVTATVGGADRQWSWDAVAADLDGSGKLSLYVANDFGPDKIYRMENGKLVDISWKIGEPDRRPGMDVSLGDLSHDGLPHIHVSNIWNKFYTVGGNYLWKFDRHGHLRDEALPGGPKDGSWRTNNCEWAWGAAFADFNLDGAQDLFVTNGFITGKSDEQYDFNTSTLTGTPGFWQEDVRKWPPMGEKSNSGHEISCVFVNRGDHFENQAGAAGITQSWDGRAAALIDIDNSGAESLIVTTHGGPPHLLRNEVDGGPGKRWIGFKLRGTRSNRDGAGAKVEVRQGSRVWYRWATAGRTGYMASSDPRLHFGIPDGGRVDARVYWPSGIVQDLKDLETGRYVDVTEEGARP